MAAGPRSSKLMAWCVSMKRHHIVLFGLVAAVGIAVTLWPREADTPTKTDVAAAPFDPDLPQGRDTFIHGDEPQQKQNDGGSREGVVELPREVRGAINPKASIEHQAKESANAASNVPTDQQQAVSPPSDPRMATFKDGIRAAIQSITPAVKDCYEQQLKQDPSIAGTIRITFEIEGVDGGGRVVSGEVPESEIRSPFFEACVLEKVGNAEFPEPFDGGVVKVTYPFHFDPGGGFGQGKRPEKHPNDGVQKK